MAETVYDLNDIARLTTTFKVANVNTDPTVVTATVRKPDGTQTSYAYNPGDIARTSTGNYRVDIALDHPGEWQFKFVGTGAAADVGTGIFYVRPDPTDDYPHLYVTIDSLKETLSLTGQTNIDPNIGLAIETASRAIDLAAGRRFYLDTTDRYYTAAWGACDIEIGDTQSVTSVTIDTNGDGSYETTWTQGTDFLLDPVNAPVYGEPYTRLTLRRPGGRRFPTYQNAIKVSGSFGWAVPPVGVRQYAAILAAKLLRRPTDAPFGFVLSGNDLGTITRLARTDPDFDILMGPYVNIRQLVA
jgi:hypothetical protein